MKPRRNLKPPTIPKQKVVGFRGFGVSGLSGFAFGHGSSEHAEKHRRDRNKEAACGGKGEEGCGDIVLTMGVIRIVPDIEGMLIFVSTQLLLLAVCSQLSLTSMRPLPHPGARI